MKDKLRELAERWRNFGSPYDAYAMGVNKCAAELLTILDTAWKAGEASGRRSVEHCTCPACQITHANDCAVHNMPAMPTGPCDCGAAPSAPEGDMPERCEGGSPECGPVEHHDSEGVPLCATCWDALLADSNATPEGDGGEG